MSKGFYPACGGTGGQGFLTDFWVGYLEMEKRGGGAPVQIPDMRFKEPGASGQIPHLCIGAGCQSSLAVGVGNRP